MICSSFDSDSDQKKDLFEGTRGVCRAYGNVGKNQWFGSVDGGPPSIRVQRDVMWMKCVGKLEVELSFR